MDKDERLPSVRVELEGLVSLEVAAPEVAPRKSSSPVLAGVATLVVLVALGAVLLVLGKGEPEPSDEIAIETEEVMARFELAANGADFHLSIAESIQAEQEPERFAAKLLQTPVSSLRGWAGRSRSYSVNLARLDGEVWLSHDKLGFAQLAEFEGLFEVDDQELLLFSDAGSLSTFNTETQAWSTITSPAFAEVDVRTDGWVALDWPRWYSIDDTTLTIVDLIEVDETIEAVETTARILISDEGARSLDRAEVLWADRDTLIFGVGNVAWLVEVPVASGSHTSGSQ